MQFVPLAVEGAFVIKPDIIDDERGFFARVFDARDFASRGLVDHFVQHSLSFNIRRGTTRGLHFQREPFAESKIVRCVAGVVFDVIVDLRPDVPKSRRWCAIELSVANRHAAYVPKGCAHGFQTLVDHCELQYLITPEYEPSAACGVRWDDPVIAIDWPIKDGVTCSERDRQLPYFKDLS